MSELTTIPIRSYRVCFRFQRRIHKVDNWRIPLPFGVPLIGIGYALALLILSLIAGSLPIVGAIVGALPAPVRYVLVPLGGAYMLTQWEIDGRPPLATGIAWLRMRVSPSRVIAFRAAPEQGVVHLADLTIAPDARSARMRRAVVTGPAEIVLRYPFVSRSRGRTLHITQEDGPARWRGKQIDVGAGQRVIVG